jgi:hypothetical protein
MNAMRHEEIYGSTLWSADDDAVVRADYGRVPTKEIALRLGRSIKAVWDRARMLERSRTGLHKRWTAADDRLLREEYGHVTQAELAARLGRTVPSVGYRLATLGLTRTTIGTGRRARDTQEITRLRTEIDHLKRGALDAAHAPTADARRLAVLMAYRLLVIDAATAAVVLGVPEKRLAIEIGKAAKLGLDITRDVLGDA